MKLDSTQHTLEQCSAWAVEHDVLSQEIGGDLSLSNIVREMVYRENVWKAVSFFCKQVVSRKKEVERERQREPGGEKIEVSPRRRQQ